MKRVQSFFVLCSLVLLIPFFAFSYGAEGGQTATITGRVMILHQDDFVTEGKREFILVEQSSDGSPKNAQREFRLHFTGEPPADLQSGAFVTIRGTVQGEKLLVSRVEQSIEAVTPSPEELAAVIEDRRTIILGANFLDKNLPFTMASIYGTVFSNANSVSNLYQETAFGNITFSGEVHGPYTINFKSASTRYLAWQKALDQAAAAEGIDLSPFLHRVYVFPYAPNLGWVGSATVGGAPGIALINGTGNPVVYSHELGHNLGMAHAGSVVDGQYREYGDYSDVMGGSGPMRQVNGPHKVQMGWLPPENIQTVTQNGIFSIAPLETVSPYTQVVKIPILGTASYSYYSYRRPLGFDVNIGASYLDRTSVHTWPGVWSTWLVGLLEDNQSFYINGVTVTQLSHDDNFSTISVDFVIDTTPPTVAITSPPDGKIFTSPQSVTITADAWDNVVVTKVEFYDNGVLQATDDYAPYTYNWFVSHMPNGTHVWTAKAYDHENRSTSSSEVNLIVNLPPTPPIAYNQNHITVKNTAETITLTGWDVNADPLTFSVVTPPSRGILSGTAPNVTYMPGADYVGEDSFTYKANDGNLDSNIGTISISVHEENTAPTADAGHDWWVKSSELVTMIGDGSSDPEDDALLYSWKQTSGPAVTLLDPKTAAASFVAPAVLEETTLTFRLKVTDLFGLSDSDGVKVTVRP
ncbi:MAG: hypothetical protein HYT40_03885 [Candidatus Sungbacteria bacterium]|uniref:Peptidase M11 gametolysin domain-containing protein n=1 Tax=Candidatus Sungiibacteriota bacterium TaxID=2750080 RepID=A0A931WP15_9BACT|nr:hypothetical protein [Candidatus Sungbacteria bacterium]